MAHLAAARPSLALAVALAALALGESTAAAERQPGDVARFRFGFALDGIAVVGAARGGGAGGAVELGTQVNRNLAVYYDGRAHAQQAEFSDAGDRAISFVLADVYNAVMVEWTFDDVVEVGLGPSIDWLGATRMEPAAFAGVFGRPAWGLGFGMDARVAFVLGGGEPAVRRSGFSLVAHIHPSCVPGTGDGAYLTFSLGLGATFD